MPTFVNSIVYEIKYTFLENNAVISLYHNNMGIQKSLPNPALLKKAVISFNEMITLNNIWTTA